MHGLKRVCAAVALAAALGAATEAAAGPPAAGVLVPDLGGVELGWTQAQVERAWGRAYGRCRSCPRPTLYFNLFAFRPEGAGVELRHGRVGAVFTAVGAGRVEHEAGARRRRSRGAGHVGLRPARAHAVRRYYALTIRSARAVSAVYVVDSEVWGFGLLDRRAPVCR